MKHQDKLRTPPTNKIYRDNYDKIFNNSIDDEWESVEKNGKITYRKKNDKEK
jgi:hypothetical protein